MPIRGLVVTCSGVAVVGLAGCGPSPTPPQGVQVSTGLAFDGDAVRVIYGDGPGTSVEGNDVRLIQALLKGTTPQDASELKRGLARLEAAVRAKP